MQQNLVEASFPVCRRNRLVFSQGHADKCAIIDAETFLWRQWKKEQHIFGVLGKRVGFPFPSGLYGLAAMWAKQYKGNVAVPCIALRALAAHAVTRATGEQTALEAVSSLIISNNIEWKIHPKMLIKINAHLIVLNKNPWF